MCGGLRAPPNPQHPLTRSCRAGEHAPTLQGAGFGVQPCPQHPNAWGTREGHGCAPNQQQKGHGDPQSTPRKGKESSRSRLCFCNYFSFCYNKPEIRDSSETEQVTERPDFKLEGRGRSGPLLRSQRRGGCSEGSVSVTLSPNSTGE